MSNQRNTLFMMKIFHPSYTVVVALKHHHHNAGGVEDKRLVAREFWCCRHFHFSAPSYSYEKQKIFQPSHGFWQGTKSIKEGKQLFHGTWSYFNKLNREWVMCYSAILGSHHAVTWKCRFIIFRIHESSAWKFTLHTLHFSACRSWKKGEEWSQLLGI